eukprot:6183533-Pleurochrysis_carterae.AAC.4
MAILSRHRGALLSTPTNMPRPYSSILIHLIHSTRPLPSCLSSVSLRRRPLRRLLDWPRARHLRAPRRHLLHQLLNPLQPATPVRNLTTDERNHFVISPEQLASVDRQLMESILGSITSPATRPDYCVQCQNSGRTLIRILIAEVNELLPLAWLAIESMMDSLLLKGLSEASLTVFNGLHHTFTRLNRLLPAHAQLGDALIAKKLCSVERRISESINTMLDVKLVVKSATGNLTLILATIREILSDFEAREVR